MTGRPLWPMLTLRNLWNRRDVCRVEAAFTLAPKWYGGRRIRSELVGALSRSPLGGKQAATGRSIHIFAWNWGTPTLLYLRKRDAKMRACRTEGGGDVGAQRLAVMAKTW